MFTYIWEQWKRKKPIVALIILGFVVGNLFLSVGTSFSVDNYNYIMDRNSGNPDEQLMVDFECEEGISFEKAKKIIDKAAEYGEIQIISLDAIQDGQIRYQPVAVNTKNARGWHIPLIEGRYLKNAKDEIVVGKNIAEQRKLSVGDSFFVLDKVYRIVGIAGREGKSTVWDTTVYLEADAYFSSMQKTLKMPDAGGFLFTILKNGKEEFQHDFSSIEKFCKKEGITITYHTLAEEDDSSFSNSVTLTVISTAIIFLVAILNVVNLMTYWMLERKRDFAIMKAMGCTNRYLLKWTAAEMAAMAFLGAAIALFLQLIADRLLDVVLKESQYYAGVYGINVILSIAVSGICGLLTALFIAGKTLRFDPQEIITRS